MISVWRLKPSAIPRGVLCKNKNLSTTSSLYEVVKDEVAELFEKRWNAVGALDSKHIASQIWEPLIQLQRLFRHSADGHS